MLFAHIISAMLLISFELNHISAEVLSTNGFRACSPSGCNITWAQWKVDPKDLSVLLTDLEPNTWSHITSFTGGGINTQSFNAIYAAWSKNPVHLDGKSITMEDLANFGRTLLSSNPFGADGGNKYVPHFMLTEKPPSYVALTQRQLAFITFNTVLGNVLNVPNEACKELSIGTGLGCEVAFCQKRAYAKSDLQQGAVLFALLAVYSHELTVGNDGSTIIAAQPTFSITGTDAIYNRFITALNRTKSMSPLTICDYRLGVKRTIGSTPSTIEGCGNGQDFMAQSTISELLTDLTGTQIGGGGRLCGSANSQDETLMMFYPEIIPFSFFGKGLLVQPVIFLGTRRLVNTVQGQSYNGGACGEVAGWPRSLNTSGLINQKLSPSTAVTSTLAGNDIKIQPYAFGGYMSAEASIAGCESGSFMWNQCPGQRDPKNFKENVAWWFNAFDFQAYLTDISEVFQATVRRVGTGPWGSGLWWGDSQLMFLAAWLGTTAASSQWEKQLATNYYIYDSFCENPANQCLVLGVDCPVCLNASWFHNVMRYQQGCGQASIYDVTEKIIQLGVSGGDKLVDAIAEVTKEMHSVQTSVFDIVMRQL